jgi:hypothetical protein
VAGRAHLAAARGCGGDAVDDHLVDRRSQRAERPHALARLGERHLLGREHPGESAAPRIAKQGRKLTGGRRQLGDDPVRLVRLPPAAAEPLGDEAVFGVDVIENMGDLGERTRGLEEPQGVARGCGVDDDEVEAPGRRVGQADQLVKAHQLVDAGQRQRDQPRDVFLVEVGAAPEDLLERAAPSAEPARERTVRVELDCVEAPRPRRLGRSRTQPNPQRVAQ